MRGLTRALWPVLSPPLYGAGGWVLLTALTPLGWSWWGLLAAVAVTVLLAGRLVPWRARVRATSPRLEAWSRRRGRPRSVYVTETVPDRQEGDFLLGYRVGEWDPSDVLGEHTWDPWGIDHPHIVCSGTTGSGKTRLMVLLALQALRWAWRVVVIDAKGGADYQVLGEHGADLALERKEQVEQLEKWAEEIRRRNRELRDLRVPVPDRNGVLRARAPRSLRDLVGEVGARIRQRMRPVLLLVDETAEIVAASDALGKRGIAALRTIVQLGRSVGVHLVLGMQRPDANMLGGGFIKHNAQSRILLGSADVEAENMVIGAALMAQLDPLVRGEPRPAGMGLTADVGGPGLARFRAVLLDDLDLLPEYAPGSSIDADLQPSQSAELASAVAVPVASSPSGASASVASPSSGSGSPPSSPASSSSPPGGGTPVGGVSPVGSSSSAWSSVGSPSPSSGSAPSASAPSGSSAPGRLRPPLARLLLRLSAWRLILARRDLRSSVRDRRVVRRARREHPDRCAACHASGVPLEVDHHRPLWAGGADLAHNLWLLCEQCHDAKTRMEARVRSAHARLAGMKPPRAPNAAVKYGGLATLGCVGTAAGIVSPAFTVAVALVGAGAFLWLAFDVTSRKGLDRADSLDRRVESQMAGDAGRIARTRDRTVVAWINLRAGAVRLSAAYMAGVVLLAFVRWRA